MPTVVLHAASPSTTMTNRCLKNSMEEWSCCLRNKRILMNVQIRKLAWHLCPPESRVNSMLYFFIIFYLVFIHSFTLCLFEWHLVLDTGLQKVIFIHLCYLISLLKESTWFCSQESLPRWDNIFTISIPMSHLYTSEHSLNLTQSGISSQCNWRQCHFNPNATQCCFVISTFAQLTWGARQL